jgi:isochorismate hydrolase
MGNNPRVEEPYDLSPDHTVLLGVDFQQGFGDGAWEHTPDAPAAVTNFRAAAASWRGAGGRVIMCREIYHPSDFSGADGEPIADVVAHHPLMSGRDNAEFYPGLVEPEDLVMRKTGFSAVAAGNLLEILGENGWDTVVMGGLTTPICVGPPPTPSAWPVSTWSSSRMRAPHNPSTDSRPNRHTRSRSPGSATSSDRR